MFSSFDALKGYHQCPLDPASQELTTFITPFGRFKFLRAPFGLSSIAENYNRRMAEAFDDLDDFQRIVDDVVVHDATRETQEQHVRGFLQHCSDRGISLNAEKFKFAEDQLKFAGFILTDAGYQIDPALKKRCQISDSTERHRSEIIHGPCQPVGLLHTKRRGVGRASPYSPEQQERFPVDRKPPASV